MVRNNFNNIAGYLTGIDVHWSVTKVSYPGMLAISMASGFLALKIPKRTKTQYQEKIGQLQWK
jgi:hypothetical protein